MNANTGAILGSDVGHENLELLVAISFKNRARITGAKQRILDERL